MKSIKEKREYVIKNYKEGYNYGLYILQIYYLIYNTCGLYVPISIIQINQLLDDYVIGPSDMPFKKFDFLEDLIDMNVLFEYNEKYMLSDYFEKFINFSDVRFDVKRKNKVYFVRVSFSRTMKKGIQYIAQKKYNVGDIVYVTGTRSGIPGTVMSVEDGYFPNYPIEEVIDEVK